MKNIQDILKSIAESRFEDCADHFKDFNHFRDCLEKTYCLIANRTAQKFVEKLDGVFYDRAQFQAECSTLCRIEFSYIYSGEFKDMFPRFKIGGVKKSVKYSLLLSALVDEGVVKANENFSYYKDNEFPKSYTLDFRFVASRIDEWFELNRDKDLEIYDALYAYYPNKLLNAKIAEAKRLYDSLQDGADGLDVRLPDEWEKSISPFGWCVWNDKLTIDGVLSGLNKFAARKVTGYRYGRYYDWFTAMPSAFRMHVREGGSPYFELTDCRAGMFWMAAILGARQGRISKDEARRMLDCCFAGSFYEMISRREKTRAVKTTFMKVMNMHGGQLGFLERSDDVAQTIVENISAEFPEWWSFMDGRRKEFKGEIGLKNHEDLTEIEREVMDELADAVKKTGVMHVRRVHDALWATEDCEDVEDMLYGIAVKMI